MKRFIHFLSAITALVALTAAKADAQNLDAACPLGFFTNAASRLLSSEMNLDLTRIEIYPTNQYTPAVHRLLQVAANVYEATTTNFYPSIFRPLFTVDGGGKVFITGYANQSSLVTQASQMVPGANNDILDPPVEATALPVGQNILTNVYGVPWIIGAKKGFPNFNAFSIETAFELVRKLEVVRDTNATTQPDITWTNQMYLMNITNYFGLSCWNSYRSNYPGPVDILVRCGSSITLTNDNNMFPYVFGTNFAFAMEIAPNWPGWNGTPGLASASFLVPLNTSVLMLTNAMYFYNEPNPPNGAELLNYLGGSPSNYLDAGIRELPHFGLLMTNRLQVAIIDYSTNISSLNAGGPVVGQIVDYVQLDGLNSSQLLNSALAENDANSFWNTNYDVIGNLIGVENQFYVSAFGTTSTGQAPTGSGAWTTAPIPGGPTGDVSPGAQQSFFRGFFSKDGIYYYNAVIYTNTQSAMQMPYTPIVFAIQHITWGANDPLVHYLASDLAPQVEYPFVIDWGSVNLYTPTSRYQPWGVFPPTYELGVDPNPCNLAFKDPLVRASDNWNFPTGQISNPNWLGRVHRGTPWQTIYLKSTNILDWANNIGQNGINTWVNWTGDENLADATAMAPVQDWHLASLLASLLTTNTPGSLVSVNNPDPNAWLVLCDGLTVLTNISTDLQIRIPQFPPQFATLMVSSNSHQASVIAGAIESARMSRPGQSFADIGDILAIPQLAEQSPFLNISSAVQRTNGISDEACEEISSQFLPLLRVDSVGSVASASGRPVIQFTGSDGHVYAIEASPDLLNWTSISTNWPVGGMINFSSCPTVNGSAEFYRSILLR
jgi:hypothetical protein